MAPGSRLAPGISEPLMQAPAPPAPPADREPGTITTFYSYKGGTGRTMALANSAWVLAERLAAGEKVLVVDWDLEAPGLHRYFPPRLRGSDPGVDIGLDEGPGLIDLFIALSERLPVQPASSLEQADAAAAQAVCAVDFEAHIGQTEHAAIHIMRAGRNDDGAYARRVNTFSWEGLFQRAPGIYRAFAERLASEYRWVLIDSRTGVTDISGICTSLLPEKLVVVFTPNRQSLTGLRELVHSATAYRRGHDDLRPLLVLPLPSRIEASMDKLRSHWRHGRPEDGITGYQPMFQSLLAECYGLGECDLGPYFDAVQIQQTPDCAYGEVISVRGGSSDRFSLASSYRVFVDRLVAPTPPWEPLPAPDAIFDTPRDAPASAPLPELEGLAAPALSASTPDSVAQAQSSPGSLAGADPFADLFGAASAPSAPTAPRQRVFLSYSSEDRERVGAVSRLLKARGLEVFDQLSVQAGKRVDDQIAEALDRADAVVVFWSQAAFASEAVRVEAEEGLRRGVLLPVLLDDARPPISFRGVQAADLRRDFEGQLPRLVEDILRIARAAPGDRTMIVPAGTFAPAPAVPMPPPPQAQQPTAAPLQTPADPSAAPSAAPVQAASPGRWGLPLLLGLALLAAIGWWALAGRAPVPAQPASPPAVAPAVQPRLVSVPSFTGRMTPVAVEIALSLKLSLVGVDEQGQRHEPPPDGLVLEQRPEAGAQVAEGTAIVLKVATQTATVPSVGGLTLGDTLVRLRNAGLELGAVESVVGSGAREGAVVRQSPEAGATVPQGTKVGVGVATKTSPPPVRPQAK